MSQKKNILITPLNWGLGHATRCIPIIRALEHHGFNPIIGSDGVALQLLQKEFPHLETIELPSYKIQYAKKGKNFKRKMLIDSPKTIKAVLNEKKHIARIIKEKNIQGIISDNRLGVRSKKVPSVFISHQINVMSGNTTWLTSRMHQDVIKKYDACWVPDFEGSMNLSGDLGHTKRKDLNLKYIGPLSRLQKKELAPEYDLMVLLSGPEPQRTILEEKLLDQISDYDGKVLFVKGKIQEQQTSQTRGNVTIYNFMQSDELENAFNKSKLVLSRSGYTTVMDLAKLGKKAFFIPTPGQYEQVYLAELLHQNNIVPTCSQDDFTLEKLKDADQFNGLKDFEQEIDFGSLFGLFEGE